MIESSPRFDHVVIAVRRLGPVLESCRSLGFAVSEGGHHPGRGSRNATIAFSTGYVEIIEIVDREEAMAAGPSRRDLVTFLDKGEGLASFALGVDDIDGFAARLRGTGIAARGPGDGHRQPPDGSVLRWQTLVPFGGSVRKPWPFLIEWAVPPHAGADVSHPNGALGVEGLLVGVEDVDAAARLYSDGLGLRIAEPREVPLFEAVGVRVHVAGCWIDLLEPRRQGRGAIARQLARQGAPVSTRCSSTWEARRPCARLRSSRRALSGLGHWPD